MRTLWPAVAAVCTLLAGCTYAAVAVGGAVDVSGVDPVTSSAEAQERRANAAENEAAERQREHDNEAIRATGTRLSAERDAQRAAAARGSADVVEPQAAVLAPSVDGAMVTAAIATVKPAVMACRGQSAAKGQVLVFVKVAPDGSVTAVTIRATPDQALGACVAAAVHTATLPPTETGGSFRYPFVF